MRLNLDSSLRKETQMQLCSAVAGLRPPQGVCFLPRCGFLLFP